MRRTVSGLYANNEYHLSFVWIYHNNKWEKLTTKVYNNNEWRTTGNSGYLWDYLLDTNNNYIVDSNNKYILVKKG